MTTKKHGIAAGVVAFAAIVASVVVQNGDQPTVAAVEPLPAPAASPSPAPDPTCSTTTTPFVPTSVNISGVKKISILPLGLDGGGVPGTPPTSLAGKRLMAFDIEGGVKVGAKQGNALFNAHTFPDGSALGNTLLDELEQGERIVVAGLGGQLCYEVTKRTEVPADSRDSGYFDNDGKPQIAIVVCSGKRLGPGEWTKRTLWFASPVA